MPAAKKVCSYSINSFFYLDTVDVSIQTLAGWWRSKKYPIRIRPSL